MFIKGYRYRLRSTPAPRPDGELLSEYMVMQHRPPYDAGVRLARRDDPGAILELHWYADEDAFHRSLGTRTAQVTGTVLDEPFPGVLVPPGTEIEELDFEDEFIGYEWHHPRMPPSRHHDYQALRKLGAALVERLAATLPSGFSLASYWTELILLRGAEVVAKINLSWALDGDEAALAGWMRDILDELQDAIAEETAEPWPNPRPRLPSPGAEVRDGALHAWFRDADGIVLELSAIPLAELGR